MYTIVETVEFIEQANKVWTSKEKDDFINYLSTHPLTGDVIPHTNGFRKIRWHAKNKGKRGGVRVIYYNLLDDGMIVCFTLYAKNEQENIKANQLKR